MTYIEPHYNFNQFVIIVYTSRYEWAKEYFKLMGIKKFIYPAYQSDFNLPAKRPRWSVMGNEKIAKALELKFLEWYEDLECFVKIGI